MADIKDLQARLRLAVRETVREFLAAEGVRPSQGESRFTALEDAALAAGDAVSLEIFDQELKHSQVELPRCPDCERVGPSPGTRDREVQTRRGLQVPLSEQKCYCPACRRDFFPSVPRTRAGRGL